MSLPISSTTGTSLPYIQGLFTATSAVTVTGLSINDISEVYTTFGQVIIMILIQIGGLGILTASSMVILFISGRLDYYSKKVVKEDINFDLIKELPNYLKEVIKIVLGIELVGAILFFFRFIKTFNFSKAVFHSIFHSISAFCNAGFTLYTNNLIGYKNEIYVNIVVTTLIILGGIGFSTLMEFNNYRKGIRNRMSLSSLLTIKMYLFLIITGTILVFFIESANSMKEFTLYEKLLSSYFHSVSTRTAGFQTMDLSHLAPATIIVFCILMFIGGASGSTAGGIKTTTLSVVFLGINSSIRGYEDIEYKGRRISWNDFNKACAIILITVMNILILFFLITLLEPNIHFSKLLFEIISAMGTVGLSTGITSELSIYSKLILIYTMFLGRVGPLTLMLALSSSRIKKGKYKYPKETVIVG